MAGTPIRVWTNPSAPKGKPSLVLLSNDALLLACVAATDLDREEAAALRGAEPAGQKIPLNTLVRLEGRLEGENVTISFQQGESMTQTVEVTLRDRTSRDEL